MAASAIPPESTTVLVVGGGPGGSYAATTLKREGLDVVLLEADKFPRYHIGESMLPSMRHYLKFIDLEEEFDKHGFMPKVGACFKLNQGLREAYTDFSTLGPGRIPWNVIRSEADEILLRHAARQGVQVFEQTRVESLEFEGEPATSRPTAAQWKDKHGRSGSIRFEWLVDASGRAGIVSTKYLKNRRYREGLRNVAVWGYWKDVKVYQEGTKRAHSPWFEALTDETGWAWFIPLHDGTTSIGVVMHQDASNAKKANHPGGPPSLTEHYLGQLELLPGVTDLIGDKGIMVPESVKGASDFSYWASQYSGDHFRIVGDAGAFIDPFFSSGVHLAMTGALSAASTICAAIKGQVTEAEAQHWHNAKVGISHTSAYKQMREQNSPVLADVNEDNFDGAFALFRPIIFGTSDTSKALTDKELDKMIDFCVHLFEPTREEQHKAVAKRYQPDLLALSGPVMGSAEIEQAVAPGDDEAKQVLSRINALKILRNDTSCESFGTEAIDGYTVCLERGQLGLVKA